jgi:hypothetical protein
MPECKTCRYWELPEHLREVVRGRGVERFRTCVAPEIAQGFEYAPRSVREIALAFCSGQKRHQLETRAGFGCVCHKRS